MYRLAHQSIKRSLCQRKKVLQQHQLRNLSNTSGTSSSNNAVIAAGAVGVGVIGTLAYAQYDENFKSSLPSWLGGSKPPVADILEAPLKASSVSIDSLTEVESVVQPEIEDKYEVLPIADATAEGEALETVGEPVIAAIETVEQREEITDVVTEEVGTSNEVTEKDSLPSVDLEEIQDSNPPSVEDNVEVSPAVEEGVEVSPAVEEDEEASPAVEEGVEAPPAVEGAIEASPIAEEDVIAEVEPSVADKVAPVEMTETVQVVEEEAPVEIEANEVAPLEEVAVVNPQVVAEVSDDTIEEIAVVNTVIEAEIETDEEKSELMENLNAALSERDDLLQEADNSYYSAVGELEATKKAFESVPVKTKEGELNEELVNIERSWVDLSDTLENSRNLVIDSKSKSKVSAFVTSIKTGSESSTQGLTLGEKAEILTHLQDYIENLKQTIKDTQQEGIRKMEEAVLVAKQQTEENERLVSARVLQNALDDVNKDHDAEMFKAKQEFEQEMTIQLKRQAAAHAQHLADAISYQTEQLNQKHEEILSRTVADSEEAFRKELEGQKSKYITETEALKDQSALAMELATARVKGLSEALTGSAVYETESRKAQELALACDSLLHLLKSGNDGKPIPLSTQIETVRKVCQGNESVEALTNAFSSVVSSRGVYTEDTLRASFKQIGNLCRQVSLVNEEHNSLFVYFLSYLKNVLTFAPSATEPPEEINVADLEPFRIVAYANYCLQRGELEQAARFVNQLKGESRKVAEEWLSEARLLIETKQTTEALNLVSSAFVIAAQLSE